MANEMVSTKEQFLEATRIPATEEIPLNAAGKTAVITELDSRLSSLVDHETHEVLANGSRRLKDDGLFNARWIAATARTREGRRIFTINDSPEDRRLTPAGLPNKPLFDPVELADIAAMPTKISEKLAAVALRLNSVDDAAVDAAAKN